LLPTSGFIVSYIFIFDYEIFDMQILTSTVDPSGRISRESTACLALMLSRVISGLKASMSSEGTKAVDESLLKIIDHARRSHLLELLCECLITSGSDIISGSTNMVPAACEACKAIWYLAHAVDMSISAHHFSFPLANSWRQIHSMQEQGSMADSNSTNLINIFVKSFLASRPMQVAVYHCLHNGLESAIHACLQVTQMLFDYKSIRFHSAPFFSMVVHIFCRPCEKLR
jgi:fused